MSFSFSKLKDALDGDDDVKQPTPAAQSAAHPPKEEKHEGWGERIKDVLDGSDSKRRKEEEERLRLEQEKLRLEQERVAAEAARKKAEEEAGFLGKVKGLFGSHHAEEEKARLEAEAAAVDAARRKAAAEEAKKKDLISRLKDVFDGDEDKAAAALVAEEGRDGQDGKEKDSNWFSKIKDKFDGDEEEANKAAEKVKQARINQANDAKKLDLIQRLKGAFDGDEKKAKAAIEAEELREKNDANWFSRIKDKFDGDEEQANKATEKVKNAKKKQEEEGWGDRLTMKVFEKLEGKPQEPEPDRSWLGKKLNEVAGGGTKGEANEGRLDKAIDIFQKRVLHEGDQHNESAAEQLKDKQIAAGIRKVYEKVTGDDPDEEKEKEKEKKHGHH